MANDQSAIGNRQSATLIECVPNFSEGRKVETIERIAQAISAVKGACVLGRHMDVDHNRSVITLVAAPKIIIEAALQAVAYIGITPIIASYEQCAAILDRIGSVPGTKGIMLIFPECVAGLQEFGERVLPLMRTAKLAPPRAARVQV